MWSHIIIDGICCSRIKPPPCGKFAPSIFCLENGHCPYLLYGNSNELEASLWAPLYLIIKNKLSLIFSEVYDKCHWWFWGKWHYDPNWLDKYPKAECPAWDAHMEKAQEEFPKWLEVALQSKRGK